MKQKFFIIKLTTLLFAGMFSSFIQAKQYNPYLHKTKLTEKKESLLHKAAWNGDYNTAKRLLKFGNPNTKNSDGQAPLHYIVLRNNIHMLPLFATNKKANLNVRDNAGNTPLHYATTTKSIKFMEALLNTRKVRPNLKNFNDHTPLYLATYYGLLKPAKKLLDARADPNIRDRKGNTPLHIAVQKNYPNLVFLLIERGADLGAKDKYSRTPLKLAEWLKFSQISSIFKYEPLLKKNKEARRR